MEVRNSRMSLIRATNPFEMIRSFGHPDLYCQGVRDKVFMSIFYHIGSKTNYGKTIGSMA